MHAYIHTYMWALILDWIRGNSILVLLSVIQRKCPTIVQDPMSFFLSVLTCQELSESLYDLAKCFALSACLLGLLKFLCGYIYIANCVYLHAGVENIDCAAQSIFSTSVQCRSPEEENRHPMYNVYSCTKNIIIYDNLCASVLHVCWLHEYMLN